MSTLQTLQVITDATSLGGASLLTKPYPNNIATHPNDGLGAPVPLNEYAAFARQFSIDAEANIQKAVSSNFAGTQLKMAERTHDMTRKARQIINGLATSTETYKGQRPSLYLRRESVSSELADLHQRLNRADDAANIILSGGGIEAAKTIANGRAFGGADWIADYLASHSDVGASPAGIGGQPVLVPTVEPTTKPPEQVTAPALTDEQTKRLGQAAEKIGNAIGSGIKVAAIVGGTATAGTILYFIFRKPKKKRK